MNRFTIVSLIALASTFTASAGDWSQFKGPNASGVSTDKNLPTEWSKDKGIKWKTALPARGVSSPVVAANKVYITCSSGVRDDRLHVLCFDAATGKQLWHRQLQGTGGTACHPKTCMAANTPVADESGVYALFATGDLAAFDADGTLRWYRSLVGDYPSITNQVGMASSPVLVKDRLIVPMDNSGESFIAAVDTKYGKNVWKVERPRDINWVTPLVREVAGKTEVLFAGSAGMTAYDATNGDKRWTFKGGAGSIPTAALDGDALYLPVAGVSKVKLTDSGVAGDPQWKTASLQNGMSSPLVYGGRVYTASGQGFIACGDAKTGKELYKERLKGTFSASPIAGDGKIYCFSEAGICSVLKADSNEFEILATNELGEEILGTPAIANGLIFIRTDKAIYAVGK
jgi:outer membrane protein assembly factor BamB